MEKDERIAVMQVFSDLCDQAKSVIGSSPYTHTELDFRPVAEKLSSGEPEDAWENLKVAVAHCGKCKLCSTRNHTVFGEGVIHPLVMDGGMSDNLPIQLAKDLGADFVVAMDVNALQRLTPEEMNTFSAVASQCLVITTQTNSLAQYKTADILLFPEVGNFGTLAFDRYDQILQKGRDICEANDDAFKKLAEEVQAAGRTLVVKSPDRESEYTAIKPKIIEKVMEKRPHGNIRRFLHPSGNRPPGLGIDAAGQPLQNVDTP